MQNSGLRHDNALCKIMIIKLKIKQFRGSGSGPEKCLFSHHYDTALTEKYPCLLLSEQIPKVKMKTIVFTMGRLKQRHGSIHLRGIIIIRVYYTDPEPKKDPD